MSTSSVNNGSQANSEIKVAAAVAVTAPQVNFAEEALVVGTSANPDGDCRRRRHRRTDQRATSIEVEFSNEFAISDHLFS